MKYLKYSAIAIVSLAVLGLVAGFMVIWTLSSDLPSLDAIRNYNPSLVTTVYSADDKIIAEFSTERRETLEVGEVPEVVSNAFIAAEDADFFNHRGVNPVTIIRAMVRNLQAGAKVQGGSTITQQVAKQILLSSEKTYTRKIKDMILAYKIEQVLSKEEIITLYLNHIYLGQGAYGVESAAQVYFGKHAKELSIPEAAILAGLPRAPSTDNPIDGPLIAKKRQLYVLRRMRETGKIGPLEYDEYIAMDVAIQHRSNRKKDPYPYFTENVRRYLSKQYGTDMVYEGGLKVYTTMDRVAQIGAQDAVNAGLSALDKRAGMRQPKQHLKNKEEQKEFLEKQHTQIVEDYYDFKLLTPEGELKSQLAEEGFTPLRMGENYDAVIVDKNLKTKSLVVAVGNRRGEIAPDDYQWALDANQEEVYEERKVRNPLRELKIGTVITVQAKTLKKDPPPKPGENEQLQTAQASAKPLDKKSDEKEVADSFFLEQEAEVQGAIISYAIPTGAMIAMVGGYDFHKTKSEFNRATQAKRQSGSTFKPFVYAAALDSGLTPATIIVDSPIVYKNREEENRIANVWRPDNFGNRFYGDTSLRNAITYSRNIPTIKLLQHLGIPYVVDYVMKLGIESELNEDLSLALGSSSLTLEELMKGWSVFANNGHHLQAHFIRRIEDRDGNILEEHKPEVAEQIIPESTAFLVTDLLKSVVERGTGTSVKVLGRPVAGKTGTTNEYKDALFLGYTPDMITGVWVGFDKNRPIGRIETGGRAAAPIWLQYMQVATEGTEIKDWEPPSSVVRFQVDAETGDVPTPETKNRKWEFFAIGTAPGQPAKNVGPDGQLLTTSGDINRTTVVTGHRDMVPTSDSAARQDDGTHADDLLRDEL